MSGIVETAVKNWLTSEVQGVVGLLVSRIGAEIKLEWGLEIELEGLKGQFTRLSWLLQGASGVPITNPSMAEWLKMIKDVVEDVDNLLDEWSYKALEHRIQTRERDKIMHTISQPINVQHITGINVQHITGLISSIYSEATKLGIEPVEVAGGEVYSGIHAREIEIQAKKLNTLRERVELQFFQGRDDDVEKLTKLLCDPNNTNSHLTVIAIVGLAGLGKTTLSKHISRAPQVTNFFNNGIIWLVVSHNFDLENLLKQMVEKVFEEAPGMGEQGLIDKLQTGMKGKKFLIILDDVWDTLDTIQWESLQSTLHEIGVSQGTTLLVTSREKKVVENLSTTKKPTIHKLKGLSPDDSWSLFLAKFHDKIEGGLGNEEKQIAERLVDKCRGVPLAIGVLADLLRGKRIEDWREIEQREIWIKEDEYGILPSLRLSYNYLPDTALKKCFAFCAIFEEDAVIKKQELICQWMAQGFLQPYEEMEPKGEEYIDDLLNRSLFQDAELDIYGNVNKFKMHYLVRSLAKDVSKGECLCSYRDEDLDKVRHLLVPHNSGTFSSFKKLQTCMLSKEIENPSLHVWLKCERLRVLVIGTNWSEDTDWKPLGKLIHLRYFEMNIKKDLQQFKLPREITKLYHLQTLCINIPPLPGNPSKTIFPEEIGNLVKLRHILIKGSKGIGVPVGLSHLTALQTLPVIDFGMVWDGRISDIGSLTNLRGQLVFQGCSEFLTVEKGRSLDLRSKSKLETLVIYWSCEDPDDTENPDANEILKEMQPNANLRNLKVLWFYGTKFPRWLMGTDFTLNKIVYLHIQSCGAHGNLILENFIYLRRLEVSTCEKLTVTFANSSSQCCKDLEYLEITECKKVKQLPDLFLLPKLETIEIWGNKYTSRDVLVGLGSLENLKELETDLQLPEDLGEDSPVCKSLEHIVLRGSTFGLPEQLQHLVELQSLWICDFEMLEAIPDWLGKLTSLERLYLKGMPKLKHLPPQHVMKALSNLKELDSEDCCLLEEDFQNKTGEWDKIAHIPKIPGRMTTLSGAGPGGVRSSHINIPASTFAPLSLPSTSSGPSSSRPPPSRAPAENNLEEEEEEEEMTLNRRTSRPISAPTLGSVVGSLPRSAPLTRGGRPSLSLGRGTDTSPTTAITPRTTRARALECLSAAAATTAATSSGADTDAAADAATDKATGKRPREDPINLDDSDEDYDDTPAPQRRRVEEALSEASALRLQREELERGGLIVDRPEDYAAILESVLPLTQPGGQTDVITPTRTAGDQSGPSAVVEEQPESSARRSLYDEMAANPPTVEVPEYLDALYRSAVPTQNGPLGDQVSIDYDKVVLRLLHSVVSHFDRPRPTVVHPGARMRSAVAQVVKEVLLGSHMLDHQLTHGGQKEKEALARAAAAEADRDEARAFAQETIKVTDKKIVRLGKKHGIELAARDAELQKANEEKTAALKAKKNAEDLKANSEAKAELLQQQIAQKDSSLKEKEAKQEEDRLKIASLESSLTAVRNRVAELERELQEKSIYTRTEADMDLAFFEHWYIAFLCVIMHYPEVDWEIVDESREKQEYLTFLQTFPKDKLPKSLREDTPEDAANPNTESEVVPAENEVVPEARDEVVTDVATIGDVIMEQATVTENQLPSPNAGDFMTTNTEGDPATIEPQSTAPSVPPTESINETTADVEMSNAEANKEVSEAAATDVGTNTEVSEAAASVTDVNPAPTA